MKLLAVAFLSALLGVAADDDTAPESAVEQARAKFQDILGRLTPAQAKDQKVQDAIKRFQGHMKDLEKVSGHAEPTVEQDEADLEKDSDVEDDRALKKLNEMKAKFASIKAHIPADKLADEKVQDALASFKVHLGDLEKEVEKHHPKVVEEEHSADMEKEERTPEDLLADMKAKFASIKAHIPADKLEDEKVQDALASFKVHLGDLEKEVEKQHPKVVEEEHPADMEKEERTPEDLLADMKAKFASIKAHIPADKLADEKVQDALASFKVHLGDLEKEVKKHPKAKKAKKVHKDMERRTPEELLADMKAKFASIKAHIPADKLADEKVQDALASFKVHLGDLEKEVEKQHPKAKAADMEKEKEERTPEDLLADMKAKFASIKAHIPADKLADEKVQDALDSFKVHLGDLEKEVKKHPKAAKKAKKQHKADDLERRTPEDLIADMKAKFASIKAHIPADKLEDEKVQDALDSFKVHLGDLEKEVEKEHPKAKAADMERTPQALIADMKAKFASIKAHIPADKLEDEKVQDALASFKVHLGDLEKEVDSDKAHRKSSTSHTLMAEDDQ